MDMFLLEVRMSITSAHSFLNYLTFIRYFQCIYTKISQGINYLGYTLYPLQMLGPLPENSSWLIFHYFFHLKPMTKHIFNRIEFIVFFYYFGI